MLTFQIADWNSNTDIYWKHNNIFVTRFGELLMSRSSSCWMKL